MSNARIGTQRIYTGRIINLDVDQVRFPDGTTGELEMVRHPGASAIVPFLSNPAGDDPQILLLREDETLLQTDCGAEDAPVNPDVFTENDR